MARQIVLIKEKKWANIGQNNKSTREACQSHIDSIVSYHRIKSATIKNKQNIEKSDNACYTVIIVFDFPQAR